MTRCRPSTKAAIALASVLVFAGALPFPAMLVKAGAAGAGLRLSGGSIDPYRFAHSRLECEAGFRGHVSAVGTDWNGETRRLYEGQNEAWTEAIDLVFYVDEDLKSIRVDAETGSGRQSLALDLATLALGRTAPDEAELARRVALRGLPLPFSLPRQSRLPAAFRLEASGLSDAASQIAASCLCLDPPTRAIAALAFFIAAASGLAGMKRRMRPSASLAATLGLSMLAVAAVILLLPRNPRIIIAELPRPQVEGSMPYSGKLVLDSGAPDGASVVRYSASDPGDLSFMAVSTPGKRGIPLSVMEAREGSFVFSSPPVVFARNGGLDLQFERWTTGWMAWQDE